MRSVKGKLRSSENLRSFAAIKIFAFLTGSSNKSNRHCKWGLWFDLDSLYLFTCYAYGIFLALPFSLSIEIWIAFTPPYLKRSLFFSACTKPFWIIDLLFRIIYAVVLDIYVVFAFCGCIYLYYFLILFQFCFTLFLLTKPRGAAIVNYSLSAKNRAIRRKPRIWGRWWHGRNGLTSFRGKDETVNTDLQFPASHNFIGAS